MLLLGIYVRNRPNRPAGRRDDEISSILDVPGRFDPSLHFEASGHYSSSAGVPDVMDGCGRPHAENGSEATTISCAFPWCDHAKRNSSLMTSLRIYVLYSHLGSFSVKSIDSNGSLCNVSARSVREAYALAHGDEWIHPRLPEPIGIVSHQDSDSGRTLWCGCSGHTVTGGHVSRGDGIRALRRAILVHTQACPREYNELRERLKRYRPISG